jgi:hypothetical protein
MASVNYRGEYGITSLADEWPAEIERGLRASVLPKHSGVAPVGGGYCAILLVLKEYVPPSAEWTCIRWGTGAVVLVLDGRGFLHILSSGGPSDCEHRVLALQSGDSFSVRVQVPDVAPDESEVVVMSTWRFLLGGERRQELVLLTEHETGALLDPYGAEAFARVLADAVETAQR